MKQGAIPRRVQRMRKVFFAVTLVAAAAASGCASNRAKTPDEFAVARNAPLIIPPDFNLAPPVAGTGGITPAEAQQQAIDRSEEHTSELQSHHPISYAVFCL